MTDSEIYDRGLEMRKQVLGAEHVQRSLDAATNFSRDIQELVTQYCWGEVWTRPGIDLKTRSAINLAMLTALNRGHELSVHVRGALSNGMTTDEIKEILMQTAIYCGVPAALESFRIAEATIREVTADA